MTADDRSDPSASDTGGDEKGSEAVLDPRALTDLTDGADDEEMDMLRRVVASYCSGRLVADARRAMNAGDWEACELSAHSLKGLSATLGANKVASAAGELEEYAGRRDAAAAERQLARVAAEHARSHRALATTDLYDRSLVQELEATGS